MARQKKPPKVLWVCRRELNCGQSRCAETTKRRAGYFCGKGGCDQIDCPGPVKYERKDSE